MATTKIQGLIGSIGAYEESEPFESYVQRFEQFVKVNDLAADKKVPAFLTLIGPKAFEIIRNSLQPAKPADKTYEELTEILKKYYEPQKCIIAERYRFHKRLQKPEESVTQFSVELRGLATSCDFNTFLDDALRDQFVCGVASEAIRRKLLGESELKFTQAVKLAVSMELAADQTKCIAGKTEVEVSAVSAKKKMIVHSRGEEAVCFRCGSEWSRQHSCPAVQAECRFCHKLGHFAKMCRAKKKKSTQVHHVDEESADAAAQSSQSTAGLSHDCQCIACAMEIHMIHLCSSPSNKHLQDIQVQGERIGFEVDTGAAVTVIGKDVFYKKFGKVMVSPCHLQLKGASESSIRVIGQADMNVTLLRGQKCVKLPIVIIDTKLQTPLLGRNWLDILNPQWRETLFIKQIKQVESESDYAIKIQKLFPKVFEQDRSASIKGFVVHIHLKENAVPVFKKAYDIPYKIADDVKKEINKLVEDGIWVPVKHSEWASPLVVVPKKDGNLRLCIDYKNTVNPNIIRNMHKLPKFDDIVVKIAGGERFCIVDLSGAYLQLLVSEESSLILVVNTPLGLFAVKRLSQGSSTAPGDFQDIMEAILSGIDGVSCYLDDVIVSGKDVEDCQKKLFLVLKRFEEYNVRVNLDKCQFFKSSVTYLGHKIDASGVKADDDKMKAIVECPKPTNVTQLKSYLGMLNFYGKFLPNLSTLLHPLYNLLKDNVMFEWTEECDKVFEASKMLLLENNVLVHYDVSKPLYVISDASPYGVGAVLCHMIDGIERPIRFASATLSEAEQNYSQLEREALGLIFAVKKFHKYIYGRPFTLVTDNQPIKIILGSKAGIPPLAASRLQRWAVILSGYLYELIQKKNLKCADMLSRLPLPDETGDVVLSIEICEPLSSLDIEKESLKDPVLSKVLDLTKRGWPSHMSDNDLKPYFAKRFELSTAGNCLCMGNRIIVPRILRNQVLLLLHEGHPGVVRMKMLARKHVFWPGINHEIEEFVEKCIPCQVTANVPCNKDLISWTPTTGPWERVHIDFLKMEKTTILIIVDTYSKWIDAHVMSSTDARKTISKLKLTFSLLGYPQELVSDNGPPFGSREFTDFCSLNGIRLTHSPPYHSQSNGTAEKAVQSCKNSIKKQLLECTADLSMEEKLANYLMFARNTPCVKTGESPADVLLKKVPRTKLTMLKPDYNNYKSIKCQSSNYQVGERVYVKSNNVSNVKWELGTVIGRVSGVTYDVNVKGVSRVYHAGHMKRCIKDENVNGEVSKGSVSQDERAYLNAPLPGVSLFERNDLGSRPSSCMDSTTSSPNGHYTSGSCSVETKEFSQDSESDTLTSGSDTLTSESVPVNSHIPNVTSPIVSPTPNLRKSCRVSRKPIRLDL